MDTDFYRKHKNDFPKSYIIHAPTPIALEEWKDFEPITPAQPTPVKQGDELWEDVRQALKSIAKYRHCDLVLDVLKSKYNIKRKQQP